jgi:hypothetical protein
MAAEVWRLSLPSRLPSLANAPRRFVVPSTATSRSSSRGGLSRRRLRATEQQGQVQPKDADQDDTTVDSNVLPYCSIDSSKRKKTLGEMEQEFLQALQVQSFFHFLACLVALASYSSSN